MQALRQGSLLLPSGSLTSPVLREQDQPDDPLLIQRGDARELDRRRSDLPFGRWKFGLGVRPYAPALAVGDGDQCGPGTSMVIGTPTWAKVYVTCTSMSLELPPVVREPVKVPVTGVPSSVVQMSRTST